MNKGCGRLTRQILSDPTYVVEIIKRRAADVIDMAVYHLNSNFRAVIFLVLSTGPEEDY